MKLLSFLGLGALLCSMLLQPALAQSAFTLSDYNKQLPLWGTSWTPDDHDIRGYYPSFYTGFAPRSQFPERIHIRTSRGNQTRVSVILDQETVINYLFDLVKRYDFYNKVTQAPAGAQSPLVRLDLGRRYEGAPHLNNFNQIVESPAYEILSFVRQAQSQPVAPEILYRKALETLNELNPGRVFWIELDLTKEFKKWQARMHKELAGRDLARAFYRDEALAIEAINTLVWGRINYTAEPSERILQQLTETTQMALGPANEASFVSSALKLFQLVTGDKYQIQVLGTDQNFVNAIRCQSPSHCFLTYPEFTTIYPTGSLKSTTRDRHGNRINRFATPGLWNFLSRSYHEVDHIRREFYYSWAPKMDYEGAGNGYHNPAVRFWDPSDDVKQALAVPFKHNTLLAVKRGRVSSGCLRLPLGHIWEMRHLMPVESEKMEKVFYFGNDSEDFDLYDINGDGHLEVMGVEYLISYGLKGASGLAKREGRSIEVSSGRKHDFYLDLYGEQNVFRQNADGSYVFVNPSVSMPSYLDYRDKDIDARMTLEGEYPLYEQTYERDKVQFYAPITTDGLTSRSQSPLAKRLVRLMGRVRGCAPAASKDSCGERAFDQEVQEIWNEVYR